MKSKQYIYTVFMPNMVQLHVFIQSLSIKRLFDLTVNDLEVEHYGTNVLLLHTEIHCCK